MIHPTAIISDKAQIGENVQIGPFSQIHDSVEIGDGSIIENHCIIGYPTGLARKPRLIIGSQSHVRSHSVFYQGSVFGNKLVTGHHVTARENINAGINLQIGTLCDLEGDLQIGDYVRLQSNVFMGKYSVLGNFVWLFPYVVITNDPHPPSDYFLAVEVHDFAAIGADSVLLPGIRIGEHSLVGANSLVTRDVPDFQVVAGSPARIICHVSEIEHRDGSGRRVYPWPGQFQRGYPEHIVTEWRKRFGVMK